MKTLYGWLLVVGVCLCFGCTKQKIAQLPVSEWTIDGVRYQSDPLYADNYFDWNNARKTYNFEFEAGYWNVMNDTVRTHKITVSFHYQDMFINAEYPTQGTFTINNGARRQIYIMEGYFGNKGYTYTEVMDGYTFTAHLDDERRPYYVLSNAKAVKFLKVENSEPLVPIDTVVVSAVIRVQRPSKAP